MSKKVHVIFKTHLDLGFTDLSKNVLNNYNKNYIPAAIRNSQYRTKDGEQLFKWTTGSYLIWQYLQYQTDDKVKIMEDSIKNGDIIWHGLAATFSSESASVETFRHALEISKQLDIRFDKKTVSAKMTDVPGHTIAIVPLLEEYGIKFLHIGMNGVSKIPNVPEIFLWKYDDHEVIVSYSNDYGNDVIMPGCDDILVFAHTHDNSGPQDIQKVKRQLEQISMRYPEHEVVISSLNDFANIIWEFKDNLNVVTSEIGDTWIHGVSSDPKKMREYNILMHLYKKWSNSGQLKNIDMTEFIHNTMLIPEHTWGMDSKRYLSDFKNYQKTDFNKARRKDKVTDDSLTFRYKDVGDDAKSEMKYTTHTWQDRSYSIIESSWDEQREYITKAINSLPKELKNEALNEIKPILIEEKVGNCYAGIVYKIGYFEFKFNNSGAITYLKYKNKILNDKEHSFGSLTYQIVGEDDYKIFSKNYLRNLDINSWAVDFLKAGMELQDHIIFGEKFESYLISANIEDNVLITTLTFDEEAINKYGAPKKVLLKYEFADTLDIKLHCIDKQASRITENLWFNINFLVDNEYLYKITKMDREINPYDVVKNGNRKMHYISNLKYSDFNKDINFSLIDSRLVSLGTQDYAHFDNKLPQLDKGIHVNLVNNFWATNFRLYYEEDIHAHFELKIN